MIKIDHVPSADDPTFVRYQKQINGRVVQTFTVPHSAAAKVDAALTEAKEDAPPHGNSRPVVICDVNEALYQARPNALAISNYYFSSAKAASLHFGYHWDAVGQALRRAKAHGEDNATVAGVSVRWADSIPGLN